MIARIERFPVPTLANIRLFEDEVNRLFSNVVPASCTSGRFPRIDVAEYADKSVLVAELPGVAKEDVKVTVKDGVVEIAGERKAHVLPENAGWVRNEIRNGKFSRSLELPHEVDVNGIAAELTNGVLRVTLPKAEAAKPREIRIQ